MTVETDRHSGFCGGVIRAISTAEQYLGKEGRQIYSLGSIVHNEEELARLSAMGLVTIDSEDLETIGRMDGETLIIRAHGEPPAIYGLARSAGFRIIDCTCPVVLKLQKDIREAYEALGGKGKVVIFGKIGHPEVLGLVGQVGGDALVVENLDQLRKAMDDGLLPAEGRVELFSQTTMSPAGYVALQAFLREHVSGEVAVHDTICSQVASRHRQLTEFALSHDVTVFVSGKTSSNGKVLCELCKSVNIRTYHVSGPDELQAAWFRPEDRVGVCGATSTPKWLLDKVAEVIENLQ